MRRSSTCRLCLEFWLLRNLEDPMCRPAHSLSAIALVLLLGVFSVFPAYARQHEHFGQGLSLDVNQPYDEVLGVVQAVVNDGVIRGTFEYKGSHELEGAEPALTSDAFPRWTEDGAVLFKIRPNTLAPEHFYASADLGTVVVRYIVQKVSPSVTRLRIDAVFEQDSHHYTRPSNGQVENNEFEAISDRIKDAEDRVAQERQKASLDQQQEKLETLQGELDRETALLKAANDQAQHLQEQAKALPGGRAARVRTIGADLKAAPYNQSRTIELLPPGEGVTILLQTPGWCRVRALHGTEGWVYRPVLEATP